MSPRRALRALRFARIRLVLPPHMRRRLAAGLVIGAVLGGAYLQWLRDSPLVRVERVSVTGIEGLPANEAERVRKALDVAARRMTTLHVDQGLLERAAAAHPAVRAVDVRADFPHALRIEVLRHVPVAALVAGDRQVAVAGDGSVLGGLPVAELPAVRLEGGLPSRRVEAGSALDAVRLAGAAPAALRPRLEAVERESARGLVVGVRAGPELVFGDPSRLGAKWAAAARVLADRAAAGAEYVDVRIPERPAAGGLQVETVAPVAPAGESETEPVAPMDPAPAAAVNAPVAPTPGLVDGGP